MLGIGSILLRRRLYNVLICINVDNFFTTIFFYRVMNVQSENHSNNLSNEVPGVL